MTTDAWQPMETAPKDGTRILLRFPPPFNDTTEIGVAVGRYSISGGWWLTAIWAGSGHDREPIQWHPIPELPR